MVGAAKVTIARLQRGLWHLRHGTLLKSLQGKWKEYRRFKRRAWWCSQRGRRQSMIATIDAGLQMILSFDGHDAWNTLAHPTAGKLFARETVPCMTWDELAKEHHLVGKVAMMKIDVEGWESAVLQGASETLSRPDAPVLQVEFTDQASQ